MKRKRAFIKRALSIIMAVVMTVGIAPLSGFVGLELPSFSDLFSVNAEAAETFTEGIYTYSVTNGEATITDCDTSANGAITIPSTLGGYPVTGIGSNAFIDCTQITSIVIPSNVSKIGEAALSVCKGLLNIKVDEENSYFSNDSNGVLFDKNKTKLIQYPAGRSSKNYIVPDSVTTICTAGFFFAENLESITIPNSVTKIDSYAFAGCAKLEGIVIPNSVTIIGDYAFIACVKLSDIVLSEELLKISNFMFYGCILLENITIPNSVMIIGSSAFYSCISLTSISIPDKVSEIGMSAFWGCSKLESVNLGNGITNIIGHTFRECTSLKSITIPDSVTDIGHMAFYMCSKLESITIGSSLKKLDAYAFDGCTELSNISVSKENKNFSNDEYGVLFNKEKSNLILYPMCSSRSSYTIPKSVNTISNKAFYGCTKLVNVVIPNSVTSIGDMAFYQCTGLTNVKLPDSVTSLGSMAFFMCTGISSITLSNNLSSIGNWAFAGLNKITSIKIPDSVTSIGDSAFHMCTSLVELTIGNGVKSIGDYAFISCSKLISVSIPNSVVTIGSYAFNSCTSLANLSIGSGVTSIGDNAFYFCKKLKTITVNKNNGYYSSDNNGVLFNKNKTTLIQYPAGKEEISYTIPSSVTSISDNSFMGCATLTNIIIPDSVQKIGNSTFNGCSELISVKIGNNVTSIGASAFSGCRKLEYVHLPTKVTSIGNNAFYSTDTYICSTTSNCYAKTYADKNSITFLVCTNHEGNVPHIHSYNIFSYNQNAHPHYAVYKCSCGAEKVSSTTTTLSSCSICNPPHVHTPKTVTLNSTCTVDGKTYTACESCGEILSEITVIPASHKWGNWVVSKIPTVASSGIKVRSCDVCGRKEETTISSLKDLLKDLTRNIEIGIFNGSYNQEVQIFVEEKSGDSYKNLINAIGRVLKSYVLNVTTKSDGTVVHPSGNVIVKIPLPEGYNEKNTFVYFLNILTGKTELINANYVDGYLVFETNKLGDFGIVEIEESRLVSIEIETPPTTTAYTYKTDVSLDGLKVVAKYSDGKIVDITDRVEISNFDTTEKGDRVATVEFEGQTATFNYSVNYVWWQWLILIFLLGFIWY